VSGEVVDRVCEELKELRKAGGHSPRYGELLSEVDEFFWKQAAEVSVHALPEEGDELNFGAAEKLLLDTGLLDLRLVHRAGRDFLELLTRELDTPGPEGVFYLSEWLSQRYRSFLATRTLPDARVAESLLLKAVDQEDAELADARRQRNELYRRIASLFEGLPGIKPELAEAIARGAVDDRVEELLLAQAMEDRRVKEQGGTPDASAGVQAKRYDGVVQNVLRQARDRTEDEEELKYLETIANLRMAIYRKSLVHTRRKLSEEEVTEEVPRESRPDPQATRAEAEAFMTRELHLLRSLLRIGSREGQVAHACSVLLNDVNRTSKRVVGHVLDLVREVDPRIGLAHDLLIAPFTGSGFFEWDRNSLIVALTPARSAEESIVNAVANLRLLDDARGGGRIASAYRDMYGSNFRNQFLSDYRNWVLRAGRGKRESLNERSYKFFVDYIGPPPGGPIVPHEVGRLSVSQREEEIKRLRRLVHTGSFAPEEAYHLAVLLWENAQVQEAIREIEKAVRAAPGDGRVLYSLGLLCRRRRLTGAARRAFRETVRIAPDTLWGIYAHEALRRMV
jgi:tetratricopeptide (TPR) repeat protein